MTARGLVDRGSHRVTLVVESRGTAPAHLAKKVKLEQQVGGKWQAVANAGEMTLRMSCRHEAPRCVTLVPGAELRPPPWLGTLSCAQCACAQSVLAPAGRYRFVLSTCDGGHHIASAPFDLGAEPGAESASR